eukprot:m.76422 g.76422  ORF g.76422 m.76422 type:complete len:620 (-) comp24895_c0_seq3:122-1981(-)
MQVAVNNAIFLTPTIPATQLDSVVSCTDDNSQAHGRTSDKGYYVDCRRSLISDLNSLEVEPSSPNPQESGLLEIKHGIDKSDWQADEGHPTYVRAGCSTTSKILWFALQSVASILTLLGTTYVMVKNGDVLNNALFQLTGLLITGTVLGQVCTRLGIPPLCGSLLCGVAFGNLNALGSISFAVSRILKGLAVALIMLRAGLSLDTHKLWTSGKVLLLLTMIPCLVETFVVAAASTCLFSSINFSWALMIGFMISDVSPAVTVPLLVQLQDAGYGVVKGIPSVLLAAGSLNSVLCIVGFDIVMNTSLSQTAEPVWLLVVRAIGGLIAGTLAGIIIGVAIFYMSTHQHGQLKSEWSVAFALIAASTGVYFGSNMDAVRMGGAGAIACVAIGAVYNRKRSQHTEKTAGGVARTKPSSHIASPPKRCNTVTATHENKSTLTSKEILSEIWSRLGQIILFGLLGSTLDLRSIEGSIIGVSVAVIVIGLPPRVMATYCISTFTGWSRKERLFTALTWIPKATVQAALSTVAQVHVEGSKSEYNSEEDYERDLSRSKIVLTVAIMSIIITAPTGAFAIFRTGRKLLTRDVGLSPSPSPPSSPSPSVLDESDGVVVDREQSPIVPEI